MEFRPERIRELRMARGHTLGTLSRLLAARCSYKAGRSAIWQWEHGESMPGMAALCALCAVFEVEPNYFFSGLRANSLLEEGAGHESKPIGADC